jgi:hypothetical protein
MLSEPDSSLWGENLRVPRIRNERFRRISSHPSSPHPGGSDLIHVLFLRLQPCSIYNPTIVFV